MIQLGDLTNPLRISQMSTIFVIDANVYLRNEFHFSGVHGAMNRSGSRAK